MGFFGCYLGQGEAVRLRDLRQIVRHPAAVRGPPLLARQADATLPRLQEALLQSAASGRPHHQPARQHRRPARPRRLCQHRHGPHERGRAADGDG